MKLISFTLVGFFTLMTLGVAGITHADSNMGDELNYSCYTSYVGPAAQERSSCGTSVELVDNEGRSISYFSSSMTIPGSSSGNSCCSSATSQAMAKCRDAYSRSERAGRCVENNCSCTQYIRQY